MHTLTARNVNQVFPVVMNIWFKTPGMLREIAPRGQRTLELIGPAAITYTMPDERVLFSPIRDANPFFHLFESLWIIAGRNDVEFLQRIVSRMSDYSDNGVTFHGAYGERLEHYAQLENAIAELRRDPHSRRALVALWQPEYDSGYTGKDMPCNTTVAFKLREGRLHMTVFNRSNDAVWGAYGANVVQFSMLQEYVAMLVGARLGDYTQVSDSLHIYPDNSPTDKLLERGSWANDPYEDHPAVTPQAFLSTDETPEMWQSDLGMFFWLKWNREDFLTAWWRGVAVPMWRALNAYKAGELGHAVNTAETVTATDWRAAAVQWLQRRIAARVVAA